MAGRLPRALFAPAHPLLDRHSDRRDCRDPRPAPAGPAAALHPSHGRGRRLSFLVVDSPLAFSMSASSKAGGRAPVRPAAQSQHVGDMMNSIANTPIVQCNEKRPFLFGLTLATYNLIVSLGLAAGSRRAFTWRAIRGKTEQYNKIVGREGEAEQEGPFFIALDDWCVGDRIHHVAELSASKRRPNRCSSTSFARRRHAEGQPPGSDQKK